MIIQNACRHTVTYELTLHKGVKKFSPFLAIVCCAYNDKDTFLRGYTSIYLAFLHRAKEGKVAFLQRQRG